MRWLVSLTFLSLLAISKAEEDSSPTGPLLLATRDVHARIISWGKAIPVTITIYNVGDRDALNVRLPNEWKKDFGSVSIGSPAAHFSRIAAGGNVSHAVVYMPTPSEEHFKEAHAFFMKEVQVNYDGDSEPRSVSSTCASKDLYGAIILPRTHDRLFGDRSTEWLMFGGWTGALTLLPYTLYVLKRNRYESFDQ